MRSPASRRAAMFALLLAACGGDIGEGKGADGGGGDGGGAADAAGADAAPPIECAANGSGSVTSATAGAEVEPVMSAWYQVIDAEASALVIDERASNCDPDAISDQPGQLVSIYFCSALAVGEYQAVPSLAGPCPDNPQVSVTVVNEVYDDLVNDTSGTLTIDQVGDCIVGSFATTAAGGAELSGSFMAYPCPAP